MRTTFVVLIAVFSNHWFSKDLYCLSVDLRTAVPVFVGNADSFKSLLLVKVDRTSSAGEVQELGSNFVFHKMSTVHQRSESKLY